MSWIPSKTASLFEGFIPYFSYQSVLRLSTFNKLIKTEKSDNLQCLSQFSQWDHNPLGAGDAGGDVNAKVACGIQFCTQRIVVWGFGLLMRLHLMMSLPRMGQCPFSIRNFFLHLNELLFRGEILNCMPPECAFTRFLFQWFCGLSSLARGCSRLVRQLVSNVKQNLLAAE